MIKVQKAIAIDFDGTLTKVETGKPHEVGEIREDAVRVINMWYDQGFIIIIYTLREKEWWPAAEAALKECGLKYHYYNQNPEDRIRAYNNDSRKISADIYIDDRNLGGVPDDWALIDKVVKRQIGWPYGYKSGWRDVDVIVGDSKIETIDMKYSCPELNLTQFPDEFINKINTSPVHRMIYEHIQNGIANPYEILASLANQVIELADMGAQSMYAINMITNPNERS